MRRLLALLNPEQYENMSAEKFAWLVKKQKNIQKKVNQQLNRLRKYDEFAEIVVDELNNIAEILEDSALTKIVGEIDINSEDKGLALVKQALAYICENYRVERKVIRNRRQLISEKMAQRTLCELPYTPLSLNENYNEHCRHNKIKAFGIEGYERTENSAKGCTKNPITLVKKRNRKIKFSFINAFRNGCGAVYGKSFVRKCKNKIELF